MTGKINTSHTIKNISVDLDESNLDGVKATATTSLSGTLAGNIKEHLPQYKPEKAFSMGLPSHERINVTAIDDIYGFEKAYKDTTKNNQFLLNLISWHKNFNISKFEYESKDINMRLLESTVFQFGSIALIMTPEDGIQWFPFTVESKRLSVNDIPKTIKLILPNHGTGARLLKDKIFTVGKDCVIFNPSQDGIFNQSWTYGKMFKFWKHYEDVVMIFNEVFNNHLLTRERLALLGINMDEVWVKDLFSKLLRGDILISIDENSFTTKGLKGLTDGSGMIKFEDRYESLASQFRFFIDIFKMLDGGIVDASPNKKERNNTSETTANNTATLSTLKVELVLRQEFLEELKKVFGVNITVKCPLLEEDNTTDETDESDNQQGEEK